MKKRVTFIFIFSLFCCTSLLKSENTDWNKVAFNLKKLQEIEVPPAKQEKIPEWLIAVFMNGKSNIEPFALRDFNRLESVGSSSEVQIVAEIGRSKGFDNDTEADGNWTGVRRYLVKKDSDIQKINSTLLMDLGEADMGDWKQAADFLLWARGKFPSKKVFFLIWDHGWGWLDPEVPDSSLLDSKSISHDFATNHYIKTSEIKNIFEKAGPVDVYASMACFMQMAEVVYEIKNYATIIVGSEEVVQLPSFNFEDFLSFMVKNPYATPLQAGVCMVDTFKEMYSRPEYLSMLEKTKYGTQLSAIRASEIGKFVKLLDRWSETAIKLNDSKAMRKAKKEVLRFEVGDENTDPQKLISFYADLCDFIELANKYLNKELPLAEKFKRDSTKLLNFVEKHLVVKNVYLAKDRTGKDYSRTHGISLHIPGMPGHLIDYEDSYSSLLFAKDTRWEQFINYLKGLK